MRINTVEGGASGDGARQHPNATISIVKVVND
jgi:hypothetical protein